MSGDSKRRRLEKKAVVVLVKPRRWLLWTLRHRDNGLWLGTIENLSLRQRQGSPPVVVKAKRRARGCRRHYSTPVAARGTRRSREAGMKSTTMMPVVVVLLVVVWLWLNRLFSGP